MNSKSKGMKTRSTLWISSERDQLSNIEFAPTCISPLHSHVWAVQSQGLYNLPHDSVGCIHIYIHTYRCVCPRVHTHSVNTCYVHMLHMHDMSVYICTSYILYRDELLIPHPLGIRVKYTNPHHRSPTRGVRVGIPSHVDVLLSHGYVLLSHVCVSPLTVMPCTAFFLFFVFFYSRRPHARGRCLRETK